MGIEASTAALEGRGGDVGDMLLVAPDTAGSHSGNDGSAVGPNTGIALDK